MNMNSYRAWTLVVTFGLLSAAAHAAPKGAPRKRARAAASQSASSASATGAGGQEALEVRGQTRALSMMLVLRSKKDKVDFVKMRTDYRPEILKTQY